VTAAETAAARSTAMRSTKSARMRCRGRAVFWPVWTGFLPKKNVLVVGRELTCHVRQKYPPASDKALAGIVANHAADLFPMFSPPGFVWKVFQRHKNYTLADVWAWDKTSIEDFRARHDIDYVVPEDMLFFSAEPRVTIYGRGEKTFLAAHGPDGFIGAVTIVGGLTERRMTLFIKSLGRMESEIRNVENLLDGARTPEDHNGARPYPPPIDRLAGFKLAKNFRAAPLYVSVDAGLVFRAAMYAAASYVFAVYLSIWDYNAAIARLRQDTERMDEKMSLTIKKSGGGSAPLTQYKELVRRVKTAPTPFDAWEILAVNLPENSRITNLAVNEKNVIALLSTRTPTEAIKIIRSSDKVESVDIVEPFHRDTEGRYAFRLVFNMKGGY